MIILYFVISIITFIASAYHDWYKGYDTDLSDLIINFFCSLFWPGALFTNFICFLIKFWEKNRNRVIIKGRV